MKNSLFNSSALLLGLALITLISCEKKFELPSGLTYSLIEQGTGDKVEAQKYLILNVLVQDSNDSTWQSTEKDQRPIVLFLQDSSWSETAGALQELVSRLNVGDSAKMEMTVDQLYSKVWQMPKSLRVPTDVTISYLVGVDEALGEEEFIEWRKAFMKKQKADMRANYDNQLKEDVATIHEYLVSNNIDATMTNSGLHYVIHEVGEGKEAMAGHFVTVNYTGRVLGGEYFDTSHKEIAEKEGIYIPQREPYEPIQFLLGNREVIRGWDEGLDLLTEGSKATFYIPSGLAYGPSARSPKIPANSILIFDVELISAEVK